MVNLTMNSTQSLCKLCFVGQQLIRRPQSLKSWSQTRCIFGFGSKKDIKSDEIEAQKQLVEEFRSIQEPEDEPQLTEEQVMAIRDKSRLPQEVRSRYTLKDIPEMTSLIHMKKERIRQRYATYGRASGLKPGLMWPSKDELQWLKGYEKAFAKPLHQMLDELRAEEEREDQIIRERETEIMEKLKQLPKYKAEFWQKYHQMKDEAKQEKAKKERLIQEVREFVGYDLDPNDPRFEEALLKKDEEKNKLLRAQRKQEKQRLALERLQGLVSEAMEREREEQTILDKSKDQTQSADKSDDKKTKVN